MYDFDSRRGKTVPERTSITPFSPVLILVPKPHYRLCGCIHFFGDKNQDVLCHAHETEYAPRWRDVFIGMAIGALLLGAMFFAGFGEMVR